MTNSIIPLNRGPIVLTRQSLSARSEKQSRTEPIGFLCFDLADRSYGVDLDLICEIVKPPPLTWVPRTDPFMLGIISIRGAVVTLVDLRQLMGQSPTQWPRTARVLVVEIDGEQIGLLVDRVDQVRRIALEDLERNLSLGERRGAEHVLFISRPSDDELLVIIDLDAILGDKLL
jgi:purine-binding chemotaxis protein CheW